MCGGALPVSAAGRGQGSRPKVLHKQTRASGDAESPGTGTVEMQLIGCENCKRSPRWTVKIPAWELMAPLSPDPTRRSKALPRRRDVHLGSRPQHYSSILERNKSKSAPPPISQHKAETTPPWMPLDELLRKATRVGRKRWDVLPWEGGKNRSHTQLRKELGMAALALAQTFFYSSPTPRRRALQPDKPLQSHCPLSTTSTLTEPKTLRFGIPG